MPLRRLLGYTALFLLSAAAYLLLSWLNTPSFPAQLVMIPAIVALKLVVWAFSLDIPTGWTDVDSTAQYAMLGRAIAFSITVVAVWYPIASYRRKPTRLRLAVAIATCLFVVATLAMAVLLSIGLNQAWRD